MTEVEMNNGLEDFVATGRTGRRNAMPDILDSKMGQVSTADLPFDMEKLKCSDDEKASSSQSSQNGAGAEGGS